MYVLLHIVKFFFIMRLREEVKNNYDRNIIKQIHHLKDYVIASLFKVTHHIRQDEFVSYYLCVICQINVCIQ